jgi:hypothetical protein
MKTENNFKVYLETRDGKRVEQKNQKFVYIEDVTAFITSTLHLVYKGEKFIIEPL